MNRYLTRLALIVTLIAATPAAILWLGHSWRAATLGALLAAALTWTPALLALEGIARLRRPGTFPRGSGG